MKHEERLRDWLTYCIKGLMLIREQCNNNNIDYAAMFDEVSLELMKEKLNEDK